MGILYMRLSKPAMQYFPVLLVITGYVISNVTSVTNVTSDVTGYVSSDVTSYVSSDVTSYVSSEVNIYVSSDITGNSEFTNDVGSSVTSNVLVQYQVSFTAVTQY